MNKLAQLLSLLALGALGLVAQSATLASDAHCGLLRMLLCVERGG